MDQNAFSLILDSAIEDFDKLKITLEDCNKYIEKYQDFLVMSAYFPRGLKAQENGKAHKSVEGIYAILSMNAEIFRIKRDQRRQYFPNFQTFN